MKIYFLGSYVNGAVNTPKRDELYEELEGKLQDSVEYLGTKIDGGSRLMSMMPKLKKELKEADVLFLHPSRLGTSYFEIIEAMSQKKDVWILAEPQHFGERGNYPYNLPNFKFIGFEQFTNLLTIPTLDRFLEALRKGEAK